MSAFYDFPNVQSLGKDSEAVADELLEQTGVPVVDGKAFGKYGDGHIRISYACSLEDMRIGMDGVEAYWKKDKIFLNFPISS